MEVYTLQACTELDEWRPYFCTLKQSTGNHSRLNTAAYKSLVSVCAQWNHLLTPGPEQNAKFRLRVVTMVTIVTELLPLHGSWDMRQLLPQYVSESPPLAWIIHISLMLCVQCHVSRIKYYKVYTRSRYSAIPPQPSQRPGQLSKTSSNLIQFMCCGKIGNHKWKAGVVFKKQSYPGRCIVNDWEWKLQARRG